MTQMKALVDKLLSNVSSGYFPAGEQFIAEKLFPLINVKEYSGKIGKYGKDHLRIVNTVMGGQGEARRIKSVTRSSDNYSIDSHGLSGVVTPRDYANVEDPFDAEQDETLALTTLLLISKEYGIAAALSNTAIVTQNVTLSGTAQFNDYLNSDPIAKFDTARTTIKGAAGVVPNKAAMSWEVYNKLRYHPAILDALGYKQNRTGALTGEELRSFLEVDELFVGKVSYNTAQEGQSDSLSAIWGKHAWLYYAPNSPTKRDQSAGFMLKPTGLDTAREVYKNPLGNPPNSTEIVVQDEYDQVITDASCIYMIKNAIA